MASVVWVLFTILRNLLLQTSHKNLLSSRRVGQRTWVMQEGGTSVFLVSPHSHGQRVRAVPDSSWEATLVAEMPRESEVPVDGSRHPAVP